MQSFESFKASRSKMDPSARKMSEYQWQQAYAAFKRVRGYQSEASEEKAEAPVETRKTPVGNSLLLAVRQNTAYGRQRALVEWIFYGAIVVLVLLFLLQLGSGFTVTQMVKDAAGNPRSVQVIEWGLLLVSFLQLVFKVGLLYLSRQLVQVLIDIPDLALYQSSGGDRMKG